MAVGEAGGVAEVDDESGIAGAFPSGLRCIVVLHGLVYTVLFDSHCRPVLRIFVSYREAHWNH